MASNKRKQTQNQPSVNDFHEILLKLSSDMEASTSSSQKTPIRFSKGGVLALREAYLGYLQQVASILVLHDKIPRNDTSIVETACSCNGTPEFVELVRQAKELLENAPSDAKKQRRRQQKQASKVTADMQAEQERLLNASKRAMLRQQEQQPEPETKLEK